MLEHRKWSTCTETMGVKLPDGRLVTLRKGDRVLSVMRSDGMPRTLSVMIDMGTVKGHKCACVRDDALDCAQARYGDTDEPCECCCHNPELDGIADEPDPYLE